MMKNKTFTFPNGFETGVSLRRSSYPNIDIERVYDFFIAEFKKENIFGLKELPEQQFVLKLKKGAWASKRNLERRTDNLKTRRI